MGRSSLRRVSRVMAMSPLLILAMLVPVGQVYAQEDSDVTVIAVSDSDGSTDAIGESVEEAKSSGADVVEVSPSSDEEVEVPSGGGDSSGEGAPSSDTIGGRVDGSMVAEETRKGVEMMEPKVEKALGAVPANRRVLVIAEGAGAGAAGNQLEKIAWSEDPPIEPDRVAGHILFGDPYRVGSAGSESDEGSDLFSSEGEDDSAMGFSYDSVAQEELPTQEEGSEADTRVNEALNAAQDDDFDSGESNNSDLTGDDYSGSSGSGGAAHRPGAQRGEAQVESEEGDEFYVGEDPDRPYVKKPGEIFGASPEDNPNAVDPLPRGDREDLIGENPGSSEDTYEDEEEEFEGPEIDTGDSDGSSDLFDGESGGEEAGDPDESAEATEGGSGTSDGEESESGGSSSEGAASGSNGGTSSGPQKQAPPVTKIDGSFKPSNFDPGNGSSGQDVGPQRSENPKSGSGEGAMGKGSLWDPLKEGELQTERSLTDTANAASPSTPGSGILGPRDRGFGPLEPSTISICAPTDIRCASTGAHNSLEEAMTGVLGKSPEEAQSAIRGFDALGRVIAGADKATVNRVGVEAGRCGESANSVIQGIAKSVPAALGEQNFGALADAATKAMPLGETCSGAANAAMDLGADVLRRAKTDPDIAQAISVIGLIDPNTTPGRAVLSQMPAEFRNAEAQGILRELASLGYATNSASQAGVGTGNMEGVGAEDAAQSLGSTLNIGNSLVRLVGGRDQEQIAQLLTGISGNAPMGSISGGAARTGGDLYRDMKVSDNMTAANFASSFIRGALN